MALKNLHTGSMTRRNAHRGGVTKFRETIGDEKYREIENWMLAQFSTREWVNTTFVAPKDWGDTPLHEIWEFNGNIPDPEERHRQSAILYGCVFYSALFERPETYLFHRHEGLHTDETTPYGLTYRRE
jgi:hypothetical protein